MSIVNIPAIYHILNYLFNNKHAFCKWQILQVSYSISRYKNIFYFDSFKHKSVQYNVRTVLLQARYDKRTV